jgi:hypothetical protein
MDTHIRPRQSICLTTEIMNPKNLPDTLQELSAGANTRQAFTNSYGIPNLIPHNLATMNQHPPAHPEGWMVSG